MIIDKAEQLKDLKVWIQNEKTIVLDIESNSLNRRNGLIMGIGISNMHTGFYVALRRYNVVTNELESTEINGSILVDLLQQLIGKKIWTYNGAFDLPFILNSYGVNLIPSLYADILLMAHTVDENRFSYGLKDIAQIEFGANIKAEQDDMKASIKTNGGTAKEFYKADMDLLGLYCIKDCLLTAKLGELFLKKLKSENLEKFFFDEEVMPHYRTVTIPMEMRGIRLDLPLIKQAQAEAAVDIKALEKSILAAIEPHLTLFRAWYMNKDYPPSRNGVFAQAYAQLNQLPLPKTGSGKCSLSAEALLNLPYGHQKDVLLKKAFMSPQEISAVQSYLWAQDGSPGFNLLSKHHLKKLFFDTLKETPLSRTPASKTYPKGQPQVDDEFLDVMAKKYAWAEDLRTFNRLNKIKGTYIDRFIDEAEGDRFYASYKQHGTVTGRLSGDFQQLPRVLEEGQANALIVKHVNRIRNFFIADEGHVLIDADYESLEPHVFAHISQDPAVIEIFKRGDDFYSTVAIKTERLDKYSADKKAPNYLGKHNKAKRQSAKAYALGIAYGEEAYKLSFELGITQEEAQRLVTGYWEGFPVLRATSDAGREQILQHGWIATETGRRRRLYEAKKIADKHGSWILNSLELWKEYKDRGGEYDAMKVMRRKLKKSLNAAINFPTQGLSASIMMRAAIAVNKQYIAEKLPALIVAQIHDELLVSATGTQEQQKRAAEILQNKMENIYMLSVKLKAEPITGTRYGEIK